MKFKFIVLIIIGIAIMYNQLKIKLESTKQVNKYLDYPELNKFFYNIHEFYNYNNESFINCIEYVDSLLRLYSDIKIGIKYCDKSIDTAKLFKKRALNDLHSIIYSIDNNVIMEKKLKKSLVKLQKILNTYLDDMIDICNRNIIINGYNIKKKYVYKYGPKAYNTFSTKNDLYV